MAMKNGRISRKFMIMVLLAFLTAAAGASAGGLKPYTGSDKIIASANPSDKSVTLDIVGAQRGSSNSFNFNGYSNGDMVIKIPQGWKVTVHYTVQGSLAHSAIIVPWSQRRASSFTEAFPGAAIPNDRSGITKGDPAATFTFTAAHAGKYAVVCAVPGHDDLGMWDELDVARGLAKPAVLVK